MSKVVIGTNQLIDCDNPIVIMGKPLFSYRMDPDGIKLSFEISSPPSKVAIKIVENNKIEGDVNLNIDKDSISVIFNTTKLLELFIVDKDTAIVNLDLRPLSIHIYTETNALYVGGSQLSANIFTNCKNGIAIGG